MKKKLSIILAILLITLFCCSPVSGAEGKQSNSLNRYNVVLVTDASGSMTDTDPDEYRYEAINLFVGLLANGGNHVGSVVFSNDVISSQDPVEVTGKNEKMTISDSIQKQKVGGWTDIGGALEEAVELLEEDGDPSLPSIMILLTDGNTELGTDEETQESIEEKEEALEEAREKGYQIYTICLNQNNGANSDEMKQIASATGGQFREVTKAEDLKDVFDLYYQMIFSTQSIKMVEEPIPDSGVLSKDFNVADLGVEEFNAVIFGDISSYALKDPEGHAYTDAELKEISYESRTFNILKVADPVPGNWHLDVYGDPGSMIEVFKIYNPNLRASSHIRTEQENYMSGEPVEFITELYEGDQKVTDISRYAGYRATLEIRDFDGEVLDTIECTEASEEGFVTSFTPKDLGTYYASINVESDELFAPGGEFTINVGNTPPVANVETLEKHINIWPFLIETDSTIDLSSAAKDAEDAQLNYKVASSTWLEDDYTLEGNKLTIDNFSVSKGSFEVQAYDSQGAYCTFNVKVTSTNIGILALILLLGGGLLVLLAILFKLWWDYGRSFMGNITAENIESGQSNSMPKSRGRLKLRMFQIGQTGLHPGCYFQATGKNYIWFISKKPVYSDYAAGKTKKIRLESGMDVRICTDQDLTHGVIVRFDSFVRS